MVQIIEAELLTHLKQSIGKEMKNFTRSWKQAGQPSGDELIDFCKECINKLDKEFGVIVVEPGVPNIRKIPCKINEGKGLMKYTSYWVLVDEDNKIILKSKESKYEVEKLIRQLYSDRQITIPSTLHRMRIPERSYKVEYTPTKGAKVGTCAVFFKD